MLNLKLVLLKIKITNPVAEMQRFLTLKPTMEMLSQRLVQKKVILLKSNHPKAQTSSVLKHRMRFDTKNDSNFFLHNIDFWHKKRHLQQKKNSMKNATKNNNNNLTITYILELDKVEIVTRVDFLCTQPFFFLWVLIFEMIVFHFKLSNRYFLDFFFRYVMAYWLLTHILRLINLRISWNDI